MPQYYKDAFAKEHARIIGEGLGEFDNNLSISTETLDFDVLFAPNAEFLAQDDLALDLYCRLLKTDPVVNLEFFSGALRPENLRECRIRTNLDWVKQKNNYDNLKKKIGATKNESEVKRLAAKLIEPKLKFCWIIIALTSTKTLESYQCKPHPSWGKGVYLLPEVERMGAIIIPELEKSPDTLWLRTLGKEKVLKEAFVETIKLPPDHPKRNAIIDLGRSYYDFLTDQPELQLSNEDTIDMRTLSEIYQANRAQSIALEQALAEAQLRADEAQLRADESELRASQREADVQRDVVKNFLTRRLGDKVLTDEVTTELNLLSSEQLDELLFQASAWNSPTQLQDYFNLSSL
jgi:hypothetical protein